MDGVYSPRSRAPDHPDLVVRRYPGGLAKCRKVHMVPHMSPGHYLCVYNPDIITLERAIKERVLFVETDNGWQPAPAPLHGVFDRRLRRFEALLARYMPSTTPVSRQEFVEYYRGRRQVIYQQAVDSLLILGVTRADAKITVFVKAEKGKPGSAPRAIQPRRPRYNVEVGKFLKPAEGPMYKAIAKVWGEKTVMKGMNARQVAHHMKKKWDSFEEPVAVGADAKRFDQHVSADALKWEHRQWVRAFRNPAHRAELAKLLSWQIDNVGTGYCSDGKLKYRVKGKRMSGDMNTGSGNCLLMCAMMWEYSRIKGVKVKLANNGDDCVLFMERRHLNHFMDGFVPWFLELGFQIVLEPPVYDFERLEFCQTHPIFDGVAYTMVRNLRAFDKDGCIMIPINSERTLKEWLGAVGDAGMSLTGGIPIWQEFYSVYQRSAEALSSVKRRTGSNFLDQAAFETGMLMSAKGMTRTYGDVSEEARYSFWLAFGITPDHQKALEAQYRTYPNINLERDPRNIGPPLPCRGFATAF